MIHPSEHDRVARQRLLDYLNSEEFDTYETQLEEQPETEQFMHNYDWYLDPYVIEKYQGRKWTFEDEPILLFAVQAEVELLPTKQIQVILGGQKHVVERKTYDAFIQS